jgi:hypothetical protein
MRDRGDLLVTEAEKGREISRRDVLIGAGALTSAILLLSACGSNESPVLDPTATVPGTDSSPSTEKSPGLIIDEQAFARWDSMTQNERELAAIDCLAINGVQEPLPSYSTGAGSHRDTPELIRWLKRRYNFVKQVHNQDPTIAEHLLDSLITDENNNPLKEKLSRSDSLFNLYKIAKSSDITTLKVLSTGKQHLGVLAMLFLGKGEFDAISLECSFKKDAEGNSILWIDHSEQCRTWDNPNPLVPYYTVGNS